MGEFSSVSPGDDVGGLVTNSRFLNSLVNLANNAGGAGGAAPGAELGGQNPLIAKVKNTTASDVNQFGILGIDGPIYDKTANSQGFMQRLLQLKGVKPKQEHAGRTAHPINTIKAGKIGLARIPNAIQCKVNVTDATHRFASIIDDDTGKLESGASGTYPMIPAETGTGVKWAIIFLGSGGGAAPSGATIFLCLITEGTSGYDNGNSIRPAELTGLTLSQSTIKMYKGKGRRYTVKDIDDPNQGQLNDLSEPEQETATSITWLTDDQPTTAQYSPAGDIELINWVKAPIPRGDRVFVCKITTLKGRARYFIIARDCG